LQTGGQFARRTKLDHWFVPAHGAQGVVRPMTSGVTVLTCRSGNLLCALPVARVVETFRPLPCQPLPDAPDFVLGLAVIRGEPTPVIDLARLLGVADGRPTRYVSLKIGERRAALAVDAVTGVRDLPPALLGTLPPLLRDTVHIEAIGRLDAELLLVMRAAHLVSEDDWARIEGARAAA
jgi:purine-binding chemotaxis protein CheW